jgi:hypothetical protein
MYSKETIYKTLRAIEQESKSIKPYVVIAQPRRDLNEKPAQNFDGYEGLHIDLSGFSHGFCNIGGEAVDVARNYLIEQCLASGAKYMLFVGEDTVLPYDGFMQLHKTAEANPDSMVVGVYYVKLSIPMIMIKKGDYVIPADVTPGQVYEAWQTGLDAALIPISLLQNMYDADPENPFTCIGHNIEDIPFIGEDNYFVYRWRQMGYKLLVDTNVQCLHMDIASGKYTAHPDIKEENYFTQIPLTGRLTMEDKKYIDLRWLSRLPHHPEMDINKYTKVNLGCGGIHMEGYLNVDINDPCDIKMDMHRLGFVDNTIEEVACHHALEHFPEYDVIGILQEMHRILVPDGKLLLEVPDLEWILQDWLATPETDELKWGFKLMTIFGSQVNEQEYHRTGFTETRLINLLTAIGFANITVSKVDSHAQQSLVARANKI